MGAHRLLTLRSARRGQASAALRGLPAVRMQDDWRGTLRAGSVRASLRIESGGWLRACQPLAEARGAEELLAVSGTLSGNVRCAGPLGARVLLAETWLGGGTQLEGETHLARSLAGILAGFEAGLRSASRACDGAGRVRSSSSRVTAVEEGAAPLALATVESAIAAMGWGPAAVVSLQAAAPSLGSWELRPRIDGAPQPVRVEIVAARLHLHRALARSDPAERSPARRALAEFALRSNQQFRLARMVRAPEGVTVEAYLHAGQLAPAFLAHAVRAVASAGAHARLPLGLLSEHAHVAQCYADAFCAPELSSSEAQP